MPLGFTRLNERTQRPNSLINFIKPLSGPDRDVSQDFLDRIAAICYPIMKANHLSVMTLEEYEPNPEFVGRNFNNGEVIQLCLKARSGVWLSFRSVQMVMMHELAHCKQMNHSRAFWKVRDGFADELRGLWTQGYYGEGLWGRGQSLLSGRYQVAGGPDAGTGVSAVCGGTYRGRGRKRKRGKEEKPKVSYAERQQRRIQKKFGKHGEGSAVGENELLRGYLESGRSASGKPKVAGSKRGRELRAAAALARFDVGKQSSESSEVGSEDETESEDEQDGKESSLKDSRGGNVKDAAGHDLFRVCEDEDPTDGNARREMDELRTLDSWVTKEKPQTQSKPIAGRGPPQAGAPKNKPVVSLDDSNDSEDEDLDSAIIAKRTSPQKQAPPNGSAACEVCSLENPSDAAICQACSHVLRPLSLRGTWPCKDDQCRKLGYVNAGDCGICGLCGKPKS